MRRLRELNRYLHQRHELGDDAAGGKPTYMQSGLYAFAELARRAAPILFPNSRQRGGKLEKVDWLFVLVLDDDLRVRVADLAVHTTTASALADHDKPLSTVRS